MSSHSGQGRVVDHIPDGSCVCEGCGTFTVSEPEKLNSACPFEKFAFLPANVPVALDGNVCGSKMDQLRKENPGPGIITVVHSPARQC